MIKLSKSCIGEAEKLSVKNTLDNEFLGMGDNVKKFENDLTNFIGRPAVCVVNGTAALHLAVQSCGIGKGDEVLVPSLTYISSFQSISAAGALPIACDINSKNLIIDIADAEKRITKRTKAIMPVHYAGGVGDLNSIYKFAKKYSLRIIEDAAHAFGTTYRNKRIGSFGDITCFSFDGIKNITSGEGGCVVSDDEDILQKIRDARLLGVEKDTEQRFKGVRSWDFNVSSQGWRYHMSNIMAAIGIEQLKRIDEFSTKRQNIAKKYDQLFSDHQFIKPIYQDYNTVVPHIYVIRVIGMQDRKIIQKKMLNQGIEIGYHYQPNHWLSMYMDKSMPPLPVTNSIYPELLSLPLHPDLLDKDILRISSKLQQII